MDIKKAFKRIISASLAAMLSITPVITSYAEEGVGGNASGSSTGGVVTARGGDFGVNLPEGRIGIRLALVNADNPSEVISVYKNADGDLVPTVIDLLYVNKDVFDKYVGTYTTGHLTSLTPDNMYSAVKTQSYTDHNDIYPVYYDQVTAYLGSEMQSWAEYKNNTYYSLGTQFVDWCTRNNDGVQRLSNGGNVRYSIDVNGNKFVVEKSDGQNHIKNQETNQTLYTSSGSGPSSMTNAMGIKNYYNKQGTALLSSPTGTDSKYSEELSNLAVKMDTGLITKEEYDELAGMLGDIKYMVDNKIPWNNTTSSNDTDKVSFWASVKDKFFPGLIEAHAESPVITVGDGENVAEGGTVKDAHINQLLTMVIDGEVLLKTPSMIESNTDDIMQAKENWCLLVEPLMYMTIFKPGDDTRYIISKQYGTISNIAEALTAKVGGSVANKATYGWFNWKALNGPLWGALSVTDNKDEAGNVIESGYTFKASDGNNKFTLTTPGNIGKYVSFATLADWNQWKTGADGRQEKVGYGVNVYYAGQLKSDIPTWDSETYPTGRPGPAPDASDDNEYHPETSYGKESKKFQITKWYVTENVDGTQTVVDVRTRKDTPHVVTVLNEGDENSTFYWMVEKWGTSLTTDAPADGDISTTFEQYWEKNKGTQSDTKPATVTVGPNDPDKSIYVKLVLKVLPKKDVDIVRVYENTDGSTTVEKELDVSYTDSVDGNSPKEGYDFTEYKKSPDPIKEVTTWNEVPQNGDGGTTPTIPVVDTDRTIYIHYKQTPPDTGKTNLLLHEDEISKQFDLTSVGGVETVTRKYGDGTVRSHGSHSHDDHSHPCHSSFNSVTDYSFDLENQVNYNTKVVYKWSYVDGTTHYSGDGHGSGAFSIDANPNINFIFSRVNKDTPTLYPNMNNAEKSVLNDMGITAEGYIPAGTRYAGKKEAPQREVFTENFHTNWQFTNISDPVTSWSHSWCGNSESKTKESSGSTGALNSLYSQPNNGTIYALFGRANSGLTSPQETASNNKWQVNGLNNITFTSRKEHLSTSEIKFYPYYRMKFTSEINGAEKDVYLTSENLSTLLGVQRVDTSISRNKDGRGLDLSSNQWSIHSGAMRLLETNGVTNANKNSLLPAGAVYTLSDGQSGKVNDTYVGFRIFSTYVADKSKLADQTGVMNKAESDATIQSFTEQAKKMLENYELQMWGQTGIVTDEKNFKKNAAQITGKNGAYEMEIEKNGKKEKQRFVTDDKKYDLQTVSDGTLNNQGANRSDLDITGEWTQTIEWRLTSDVDGTIKIYKDGAELESIPKTSRTISNSEVAEFNSRTKLVDNYIDALDRNLGSNRSGNKWYNEGWDQVNCIERRVAWKIGLGTSETERTAALNIKANGYLNSRTDMFTEDAVNNRTWKFYTSTKSLAPEAASKQVGYVGTFNGTDVFIPGIDEMLTSKLFYTSNTTVMDLN